VSSINAKVKNDLMFCWPCITRTISV
jgi:hypothetical protein